MATIAPTSPRPPDPAGVSPLPAETDDRLFNERHVTPDRRLTYRLGHFPQRIALHMIGPHAPPRVARRRSVEMHREIDVPGPRKGRPAYLGRELRAGTEVRPVLEAGAFPLAQFMVKDYFDRL